MGEQTTQAAMETMESLGNVSLDNVDIAATNSPKLEAYLKQMTAMIGQGMDNLAHAGANIAESVTPKGIGVGQGNNSLGLFT